MKTKTKSRLVFWGRMAGWLGIGVVTPVTTFAVKFGLFKSTEPVVDELGNVVQQSNFAINGWGIVCCLLIGSYVMQILKEIANANKGYSLTKQCYEGLLSLLPYIIAYGVCYFLNGVIAQTMYCLAILIVCKAAATPLNPLPKWRYTKSGVEDYSDLLSSLTQLVKSFKRNGGSSE